MSTPTTSNLKKNPHQITKVLPPAALFNSIDPGSHVSDGRFDFLRLASHWLGTPLGLTLALHEEEVAKHNFLIKIVLRKIAQGFCL